MEKFFGGLLCITLLLIPNNVFCQETKKALA
jgi:hypothetical protein